MPSPQWTSEPPGSGIVRQAKLQRRLVAAMLLVAALGPFVRALSFGFVYDDTWIVQHNPAIVGWRSLLTLWQHPYWMDAEGAQAGLYRPVHTALLAIIRNLAGGWPVWFHFYGLLLHGVVTLLVWRMLARGVRPWVAALGALWFAVHPVHVEAVASISNSAETLVALWTLLLFFRLAGVAEREAGWRQAIVVATLFLLAMLSKESGAMSLAIALLAAETWRPAFETRSQPRITGATQRSLHALWRKWHRVAIASVATIIAVGILRSIVLGSRDASSMAAVGIEDMSLPQRVWAMMSLGPVVMGLLGWPRIHNPHYGPSSFPTGFEAMLAVATTVVVLACAVVLCVRLARQSAHSARDTRPLAAIGWTLLAFLPASNLFVATGQILAERTLYVSSVGVAMFLAWGMDRVAAVISERLVWKTRPNVLRLAMVLACGATVAVCVRFAVLTQRSTAAWSSQRALIDQMIAADPHGYRGYYLLALELRLRHAVDSGGHEFAVAYGLYTRDPQLDRDYAQYLLQQQRAAEAVHVSAALMDDSQMLSDGDAIAVYLESRGRVYGADSVLAIASRLYRRRPHPRLALYLGLAHEARAERTAALEAYRAGLRIAPGDSLLGAHASALLASCVSRNLSPSPRPQTPSQSQAPPRCS